MNTTKHREEAADDARRLRAALEAGTPDLPAAVRARILDEARRRRVGGGKGMTFRATFRRMWPAAAAAAALLLIGAGVRVWRMSPAPEQIAYALLAPEEEAFDRALESLEAEWRGFLQTAGTPATTDDISPDDMARELIILEEVTI